MHFSLKNWRRAFILSYAKPFTRERTCLTLCTHPSQSILTLSAIVCICFFFLRFLTLLSKVDKYSKVPSTPIFCYFKSLQDDFCLGQVPTRFFLSIKQMEMQKLKDKRASRIFQHVKLSRK